MKSNEIEATPLLLQILDLSVENQLHRHVDVTFSEDICQTKKDNAPQNLSVLRKLALQLLKRTPAKVSIKRKGKKAAHDNEFLTTVLQQLWFGAMALVWDWCYTD